MIEFIPNLPLNSLNVGLVLYNIERKCASQIVKKDDTGIYLEDLDIDGEAGILYTHILNKLEAEYNLPSYEKWIHE